MQISHLLLPIRRTSSSLLLKDAKNNDVMLNKNYIHMSWGSSLCGLMHSACCLRSWCFCWSQLILMPSSSYIDVLLKAFMFHPDAQGPLGCLVKMRKSLVSQLCVKPSDTVVSIRWLQQMRWCDELFIARKCQENSKSGLIRGIHTHGFHQGNKSSHLIWTCQRIFFSNRTFCPNWTKWIWLLFVRSIRSLQQHKNSSKPVHTIQAKT